MRKQLLTCLLMFLGTMLFAAEPAAINQYDTVYFDLLHAVIANDRLELPVFIKSDDNINSLDFAMKFDLQKLQYDTLLVQNTDMSPLVSYNTNDSTLRLTSFSVQTIPNGTTLVTLRFKIQDGALIQKKDFNSLTTLLNGDACTAIIITAPEVATALGDMNAETNVVSIYPIPATGVLNIETSKNATVQLLDMNGRQMLPECTVKANVKQTLNTQHLPAGNYFIRTTSGHSVSVNRITIAGR